MKKDAIDVVIKLIGGTYAEPGVCTCGATDDCPFYQERAAFPSILTCDGTEVIQAKTRKQLHRKLVNIAKAILRADGYKVS